MAKQVAVGGASRAQEQVNEGVHEVGGDLGYQRLAIVNVVYYGMPATVPGPTVPGAWVLIDAGVWGTKRLITSAVDQRFGAAPPAAIVMTHGHFDHVGALVDLAHQWQVPVYAHPLEMPYLNGQSSYPPPDPQVGGGLMSTLSRFYPRGPVDVSRFLRPLPSDGSVPSMPGWQWIHTPGHTPGHISLWRQADRVLIAGDAFITTAQESAYAALTQPAELHGPPMYYTPDWESSAESVRRLAALEPELAITGHGPALQGPQLRTALRTLAENFHEVAVPRQGRYVSRDP